MDGVWGIRIKEKGDKYYFWGFNYNGLFAFDKKSHRTEYLACAPEVGFGEEALFFDLEIDDENIYGIPYFAKKLCIYNIRSKQMESIEVGINSIEAPYFQCAFFYHDYLYMLPRNGKEVCVVDPRERSVRYILMEGMGENVQCVSVAVVNDYAYVTSGSNQLIEFNLLSEKFDIVQINQDTVSSNILYYKDLLWLLTAEGGNLLAYSPAERAVKKMFCLEKEQVALIYPQIMVYNDHFVIIPGKGGEEIIEFYPATEEIRYHPVKKEYVPDNTAMAHCGIEIEGRFYINMVINGYYVSVDENQDVIIPEYVLNKDLFYEDFMKKNPTVLDENNVVKLPDFLNFLK